MTKAVRVHKVGGPEALVYEPVELAAPGAGEVRIRQHAVGLNFIDVYYRTGLYKAALHRRQRSRRRGRDGGPGRDAFSSRRPRRLLR
jgi:NADPH:quinone reductase-like Zn-dependent oxidoreductase